MNMLAFRRAISVAAITMTFLGFILAMAVGTYGVAALQLGLFALNVYSARASRLFSKEQT